jgi:hypothetical protein
MLVLLLLDSEQGKIFQYGCNAATLQAAKCCNLPFLFSVTVKKNNDITSFTMLLPKARGGVGITLLLLTLTSVSTSNMHLSTTELQKSVQDYL